ncbi:MAG: hypothetical protein COS76_00835 [Candidatus Portnoybacteria bacterium CG06_land_8_20_14_3_00_39_12]|uniref:Galactokinase n=1 Tax=Candidatus Portnoybacteria bacterium CG06_land_8_20_14_3_00_39_12 TaxID=1974809 RepID=A0A2M7AXZ3_9BACT|nr:MAG: hypothetical protein COS76_00835 [Candidatus Portnoybacteria bacterium CG06_land_8_20_14_3_00_39_12]
MDKKLFQQLGLLQKEFEKLYGKGKVFFAISPARINIIGEHIDYIEYFKTAVLPFASKEHYMLLAFRKRNDQKVRCASLSPGFSSAEFSLKDFKASHKRASWEDCLTLTTPCKPCWTNYIKASCFYLRFLFPKKNLKGMDLLVFSTIPIAGGASSSSALVVAIALALRGVNGLKIDNNEIAESSSKAEWFCGTRGGKMDHATMCFGLSNKVLLINFKPFGVKYVSMPNGYSWVTFYTTKADKGNELTCQYNERSAVSRIVIPTLLKKSGSLPKSIILGQFAKKFPNEYLELTKTYPVLIQTRSKNFIFPVKKYADHHLQEIARVNLATKLLQSGKAGDMAHLGKLLNQTHISLRDLYGVSTHDLEKVFKIANSVKGVLGARVMGGGFGGNLLVLVKAEQTEQLINKIKEKYYLPNKRKNWEKDIMVSTAGEGARLLPEKTDLKVKLISKVNDWKHLDEKEIFSLVKEIKTPQRKTKVIIVAAGKGTRAKKSGLLGPKVLAPLCGKPALIHVLEKFPCKKLNDRSIFYSEVVVVVSPQNQKEIKKALGKRNVKYVLQKKALGTGDAVFQAMKKVKNFEGDVVVIWGKQALVKKETIQKTILLHRALGAVMSFPTTNKKNPYAPLIRAKDGWVKDSRETNLEQSRKQKIGEDNVGFFVANAKELWVVLQKIRQEIFNPKIKVYQAPKGEFGFPNLITRKLASKGEPIFAFCMAQSFEAKGINEKKDLKIMEKYL